MARKVQILIRTPEDLYFRWDKASVREMRLVFSEGRELVLRYRNSFGGLSGDTLYRYFVRPLRTVARTKTFRVGKTYEAPEALVYALLEDFVREHPRARETAKISAFFAEEVQEK